ncbi:MAG: hypothetical protein NTX05_05610, partial [Fusobacteria bacterium]|nr:hypothetical protein [Fusobacteriota bacterium]
MKRKNYMILILNLFTFFCIIGGSSMASNYSNSTQSVIGTYHENFSSNLSTMNLNMKAAVITISYENTSNASITATLLQNNITS